MNTNQNTKIVNLANKVNTKKKNTTTKNILKKNLNTYRVSKVAQKVKGITIDDQIYFGFEIYLLWVNINV